MMRARPVSLLPVARSAAVVVACVFLAATVPVEAKLFGWGESRALGFGISVTTTLSNQQVFHSAAQTHTAIYAVTSDERLFGWGLGLFCTGKPDLVVENATTWDFFSEPYRMLQASNPATPDGLKNVGVLSVAVTNQGNYLILTSNRKLFVAGPAAGGLLTSYVADASECPTEIGIQFEYVPIAITGGDRNFYVTTQDGSLFGWGNNGPVPYFSFNPDPLLSIVEPPISRSRMVDHYSDDRIVSMPKLLGVDAVDSVAIGGKTGAACTRRGALYLWGYRPALETLCNNPDFDPCEDPLSPNSWPAQVGGIPSCLKVYAHDTAIFALLVTGEVISFGVPIGHILGRSDAVGVDVYATDYFPPGVVEFGADVSIIDIALGGDSGFAVFVNRTSGENGVFSWGLNDNGQLMQSSMDRLISTPKRATLLESIMKEKNFVPKKVVATTGTHRALMLSYPSTLGSGMPNLTAVQNLFSVISTDGRMLTFGYQMEPEFDVQTDVPSLVSGRTTDVVSPIDVLTGSLIGRQVRILSGAKAYPAASPAVLVADYCQQRSFPSFQENCVQEVWVWGPSWTSLGAGGFATGSIPSPASLILPTELANRSELISEVAVGGGHAVFMTQSGKVYGAGNNFAFQLGQKIGLSGFDHSLAEVIPIPTPVAARHVAASTLGTWMVSVNGSIFYCGKWDNHAEIESMQIYDTTGSAITPGIISTSTAFVGAGNQAFFLVTSTGKVWVWGAFLRASDGNPIEPPPPQFLCTYNRVSSFISEPTLPVQLPASALFPFGSPEYPIRKVSPGRNLVLFETDAGALYLCSEPPKLGNVRNNVPVSLPGGRALKSYSVGSQHAVALATDGTVWTLGYNGFGQRGFGTHMFVDGSVDFDAVWQQIKVPSHMQGRMFDSVHAFSRSNFLASEIVINESAEIVGVLAPEFFLSGSGLGPIASDLDMDVHVGDFSFRCSPTMQSDNSTLKCNPESNLWNQQARIQAPTPVYVQITRPRGIMAGEKSNLTQVATLINFPPVTACLPSVTGSCPTVPVNAKYIVVHGSGFGTDPKDLVVYFHPYGDCLVFNVTDSTIWCKPPPALRLGHLDAVVSRGAVDFARSTIAPHVQPILILSSPPEVNSNQQEIPSGVASLVITGTGFGDFQQDLSVLIGGDSDCPIVFSNDTYIECNPKNVIAADFRGPLRVIVSRSTGDSAFQTVASVVAPPTITTPPPAAPPVPFAANAKVIVIPGSGFGTRPSDISVTLSTGSKKRASVSCAVQTVSATEISCIPSGALGNSGESLYALVTRLGASSGTLINIGIIVAPPSISETAQEQFLAVSAIYLSITGSNFAPSPAQSSNLVSLSSGSCRVVDATSTSIKCLFTSVPDAGVPLKANVSTYGGSSQLNVPVASIVPPPTIQAGQSNSLQLGQSRLTITGAGFDARPSPFGTTKVFLSYEPNLAIFDPVNIANRSANSMECKIVSVITSEIICDLETALNGTGTLYGLVAAFGGVSQTTQVGVVERLSGLSSSEKGGAVAGGVIAAVIVIIAAVLLIIYRRRVNRFEQMRVEMEAVVPEDMRAAFSIRYRDITFVKKLGEGDFGAVWLAMWRKDYVAVKKLTASQLSNQVADFYREAALMMAIPEHPNVVKTYGLCQELGNLCLVMELYTHGSLDKYIADTMEGGVVQIDEATLWRIARGVASGMMHLAANSIVHRDLAARNVLLGNGLKPAIADFGFSRVVGDSGHGQTRSRMGPIKWMPPESLATQHFSEKSDVWAYGVTLFETLYGRPPYGPKQLLEIGAEVQQGLTPLPELDERCPKYLRNLMEMLFAYDPAARPTFENVARYLDLHRPESVPATEYSEWKESKNYADPDSKKAKRQSKYMESAGLGDPSSPNKSNKSNASNRSNRSTGGGKKSGGSSGNSRGSTNNGSKGSIEVDLPPPPGAPPSGAEPVSGPSGVYATALPM